MTEYKPLGRTKTHLITVTHVDGTPLDTVAIRTNKKARGERVAVLIISDRFNLPTKDVKVAKVETNKARLQIDDVWDAEVVIIGAHNIQWGEKDE